MILNRSTKGNLTVQRQYIAGATGSVDFGYVGGGYGSGANTIRCRSY